MSTPTHPWLDRLVDDAAVFPPRAATLEEAVAGRRALAAGRHAAQVGPLLVPATATAALQGLLAAEEPFGIGLVCRPGDDVGALGGAVTALAGRVVAVEGPVAALEALTGPAAGGRPVAVEVPWDDEGALDAVAAARAGGHPVVAKLRTGGLTATAHPGERTMARFLVGCTARDLPFKLTAGLHHALRHTSAEGFEQHGVLNVLAATAVADRGEPAVAALLAEREPAALLTVLHQHDPAAVRQRFTAFGCCDAAEPLTELEALL